MLLFLGHLQSYPTPECIRFNERCQVTHISIIPQNSKFLNTEFSGVTDNNPLEIEVLLHAQPLSIKQLQPLKKTLLNYSPALADPTFPISYPENVGLCASRFLIIRCNTSYATISLAIYGTVLSTDPPRPTFPASTPAFPFPQTKSVEDMLSGAAWKDVPSSSVGGTGPYIPRILLGKVDSEEEREARKRSYRERYREEQVQNALAAVGMLRNEGIISEAVAEELQGKVHDEEAFMNQIAPILIEAMNI